MARFYTDPHFKLFYSNVQLMIMGLDSSADKDFNANQKKHVESLIKAERRFKSVLQKHTFGPWVYRQFISFIVNDNILAARPYFRERQKKFSSGISPAISKGKYKSLYKFGINYPFIVFVLGLKNWGPGSPITKAANEVMKIRKDIVTANIPLAVSRAKIFRQKTPEGHLQYMDLIQTACEGLCNAVDKFVLPYSPVFRSVIIGRCHGDMISSSSIDQDTILTPYEQESKKIKDFVPGDRILCVNNIGEREVTEIVALHDHGMVDGYQIAFDDGYQMVCSAAHKFLTQHGMLPLSEVVAQGLGVLCDDRALKKDLSLRNSLLDNTRDADSQKTVRFLSEYSFGAEDCSWQKHVEGEAKARRVDDSLWGYPFFQKLMEKTRTGMFGLSCEDFRDKKNSGQGFGADCNTPRGLANILRIDSEETQGTGFSLQNMSSMSIGYKYQFEQKCDQMEGRKPRKGKGPYGPHTRYSIGSMGSRTEEASRVFRESAGFCSKVDGRKPGEASGENSQTDEVVKGLQDGGLVEVERNLDVGGCANSLWEKVQTNRLRVPGPQDLGGGGRGVPFYSNIQIDGSGVCSTKRRDVEQGMSSTRRRDVDSIEPGVLYGKRTKNEARMAGVAYKYAPLANTGSLVLRSIVRISAVGARRMYDLEVSHPKHNFLLPNGVITSNSDTLLHFFPSDKRKIYRANKFNRGTEELNYDAMAHGVNDGIGSVLNTNADEIRNLTMAASHYSLDMPISEVVSGCDEKTTVGDGYTGDENLRPDVAFENAQVASVLHSSIDGLDLLERKLLALKGIRK